VNQMSEKPHALVVGGTGMLRGVSMALAREGYVVSVIGRSIEKLTALIKKAQVLPGEINGISVDYNKGKKLEEALRMAVASFGPIELAVIWIHNSAPDAPVAIAKYINNSGSGCRYIHILGSSAADPSKSDVRRKALFLPLTNINYQEVILGFKVARDGSRWLTNDEISFGVLESIKENKDSFVVGTVKPWEKRPG